ncbi:MAG: alpha-galactosidase [Eggerthellaceae bacterium]|nr:alpha-galactosidase [Eggerthellaceae bacterium]
MFSYFRQIGVSDNTDNAGRIDIRNGYSDGCRISTIGAHVSVYSNHQTRRKIPLQTKFQIGDFGLCSYDYNLCELLQHMPARNRAVDQSL